VGLAAGSALFAVGSAAVAPMAPALTAAGSAPPLTAGVAGGVAGTSSGAGSRAGDCPSHATTPSAAIALTAMASGRHNERGGGTAAAAGTLVAAWAASSFAALGAPSGEADAASCDRDRRGRAPIIDDGEATWTLRYRARLSAARQGPHSMAPGNVECPQIVHFMLESHPVTSPPTPACGGSDARTSLMPTS